MLLRAVERAWREQRRFTDWEHVFDESGGAPKDFDTLISDLPAVFHAFDTQLFGGALFRFLETSDIPFVIRSADSGPAGLTTYDHRHGMQIFLNKNAWQHAFPAMVGGMLCHTPSLCLAQVFAHESIHVLLFAIYLSLGMTMESIEALPTLYDTHHNALFVTWLKIFFNQDTIDNSLLLHSEDARFALTFDRNVAEIEAQCLPRDSASGESLTSDHPLQVWHDGRWKSAEFIDHDKMHHSIVTTVADHRRLQVPNGLLRC
jgi:hypothetical protein